MNKDFHFIIAKSNSKTGLEIQTNYWISDSLCYRQYCYSDGTSSGVSQISEREYINAYNKCFSE